MRRIVLLALALVFSGIMMAQQSEPAISWAKTVHDFGTFNEADGVQTAIFEFTNTGDKPLFLTNVKASCGCTATDYTKEPVQPGAKGYVKASYNPKNRPGKFTKQITVTTNEFQPTSIVRITGEVIPAVKPEEIENK